MAHKKGWRKESGFNRLANTYKGEGLSFMELDNMLTSLRVYYNNEGNKPKKRRSAFVELICGDNNSYCGDYRCCAGHRIL